MAIQRTLAFLATLTLTWFSASASANDASSTNIVIIFADDLGYGDVSCYGAKKIKTPNIDSLARDGMMFTDAHAAASICSPSRFGLTTGDSPWRLHKKGNGYQVGSAKPTMASFLKGNGYTCAAIGKWHLGYSKDWNKVPITGPLEVGFDYHFGVPTNHNDSTRAFIENHDLVGRKPSEEYRIVDGQEFPDGLAQPRVDDQVDTTLTSKAVSFIRKNADKPFFLYFTPCAPHTHVTPAAEFRGTSECGLFGDHVQELDHHVGTILRTLDDLKLSEKTLVIFASDNGATPKDFAGTNKVKLNLADDSGTIRTKFKTAKEDAKKMGHVTNGPWRDGKGHPYEGGHRVPFIARWPRKIPAGTKSDYTLVMTDLFATAADVVDKKLPDEAAVDSVSVLPTLLGNGSALPKCEFVFIQGDDKDTSIAVRSSRWKLIVRYDAARKESYELYNLTDDPGESSDVSNAHSAVVAQLANALAKAEVAGRTRP